MATRTSNPIVLPALAAAVFSLCARVEAAPPKEGRFDYNYCLSGKYEHHEVGKNFGIGTYDETAGLYANGENKMFDGTSARCLGTYSLTDGKLTYQGYCFHVDADGDKFTSWHRLMDGTRNTWEAIAGTGKYEGMVVTGSSWRIGQPPALADKTYHACNRSTGTYKLK